MELLGQMYVTSKHSSAAQIAIPSGYTYYYIPVVIPSLVSDISISYSASRLNDYDVLYFALQGSDSTITYSCNERTGYGTTSSECKFLKILPHDSYMRYCTGYILYRIVPCQNGYINQASLFLCGYDWLYYGYYPAGTKVYTLSQCTPTKITISGTIDGLPIGTEATVYGIK